MKRFFLITCFIYLFAVPSVIMSQTVNSSRYSPEFNAYYEEGLKEYNKGNYVKAKQYFHQAAGVKNNGDPELAGKRINECNEKLKGLLSKSPESKQMHKQISEKEYFDSALALFEAEDYSNAIPLFEKSRKKIPESDSYIEMCKDYILKKLGYIKVEDIEFSVTDPIVGQISNFGDPIYASDINDSCHLCLKVKYVPLDDGDRKVTFKILFIDKNNDTLIDPTDVYGDASATWFNRTINWAGSLRGQVLNIFSPGRYRCELFSSNVKLYTEYFEVELRSGEASFLTVNGKDYLPVDVEAEGGLYTFNVKTDAPFFKIDRVTTNIDERCQISQDDNSISVKFRPNYTFRPIDANLNVVAGGRVVRLSFNQRASNVLANGSWLPLLDNLMTEGVMEALNFVFKGEDMVKAVHSDIINMQSVGMWYIGELVKKNQMQYGMYLSGIPKRQSIQGFTTFFVGSFQNRKIQSGNCYDSMGNLIYSGDCEKGIPIGNYPERSDFYPSDNDMNRRFDYIVEDDGSSYLGETYKGKRDGYGIYFDGEGGCWFGSWHNNASKQGTYINRDGTVIIHDRLENISL